MRTRLEQLPGSFSSEVVMKPLLCLILLAGLSVPVLAQDTSAVTDTARPSSQPLYRDPHKARILGSVFPGAGHFYAGEYLRGYGYYLLTVDAAGAGVLTFIMDRCTFSFLSTKSCDPGPQWPHQAAGIALIGVSIWTWVASARDAGHAAERANERHERRALRVKPLLEPANRPDAQLNAGLSVGW